MIYMAITNKKLIKLLGLVDVFGSQEITTDNPKTNSDITYTVSNIIGTENSEYRVIQEDIDETTVSLILKAEQLRTLKSIQKMLKFFTILTIVAIICAFLLAMVNS